MPNISILDSHPLKEYAYGCESEILMSDIHRRSVCCHAEVLHPHPMGGNQLNRALSLICSTCGDPADAFEVVIGSDFLIWPLPKGFSPPKKAKIRVKKPSDEDNPIPYPLHLPIKVIKQILWNIR